MSEKDSIKRVNRKLIHWNLYVKCDLEYKRMVQLEEKRKLSYMKIKELSNIECDGCKVCKMRVLV